MHIVCITLASNAHLSYDLAVFYETVGFLKMTSSKYVLLLKRADWVLEVILVGQACLCNNHTNKCIVIAEQGQV